MRLLLAGLLAALLSAVVPASPRPELAAAVALVTFLAIRPETWTILMRLAERIKSLRGPDGMEVHFYDEEEDEPDGE